MPFYREREGRVGSYSLSIVRSLMYVMVCTKPNIAHYTNYLSNMIWPNAYHSIYQTFHYRGVRNTSHLFLLFLSRRAYLFVELEVIIQRITNYLCIFHVESLNHPFNILTAIISWISCHKKSACPKFDVLILSPSCEGT